MIIQGSEGSMVLFYKDMLIGGFPLGKFNKYKDYQEQANVLIVESLRLNKPIKFQIKGYVRICNLMYDKKVQGKKISGYDFQLFSASLLSLVKLKILDEDDVVFIAGRKKGNYKTFNQFIP
tara:strand:- start:271 stop:633 length:363 start_codon:yes stop_codon:yes gene_type:complete